MKLSIDSILFFTSDLERAEEFYVDGLGLRVTERSKDALTLDAGGTSIILHKPWKDNWPVEHQSIFVTLGVEDIQAYFSLLAGKQIVQERDHTVFEATERRIKLKDPDGHFIQIVDKKGG